jgi:outer membrane lipoprotein-sorting protein
MSRPFAIALVLLAACGAQAQKASKEVEKLLSSMRTAYQAASSATVDVLSITEFDGKEEKMEVRLDYAKPNLIRLIFSFRGSIVTRISDGKKVSTKVEGGKASTEALTLDALGGGAPINLESLAFFDWKRQLSTEPGGNMRKSEFKLILSESWKGRTWIVLEETAHEQDVFVRYFVDPDTYMIWRCDVKSLDKKRTIMTTEVRKLLLNPKLDPKLFMIPKD